jgi:DeoR/GlpR family transcriptional regulator of sugar metabolism
MLSAQRRRHIIEELESSSTCTISELSQKYSVSEMTIRRDLKLLEEQGQVQRTHGGAIRTGTSAIEPRYVAKQQLHAVQKARIARYAAEKLVADNDIIALEGGTTVTTMARYLSSKQYLTVVTNGLHTANELRHLLPNTTVICSGGILRDVSFTFVGPVAEGFFREFYVNTVFVSATGLTLESGFTAPNMLETQVRKAMVASARQVIVLLDSSKFGVQSLTVVLPADGPHILITDEGAPRHMVEALRRRGVDVRVV